MVTKVFAPQLIGLDPLDRSKVQQILPRTVHNPTAKGALDIALWDVIGISLGTPVTNCWAGSPTACGSPTCSASSPPRNYWTRPCVP